MHRRDFLRTAILSSGIICGGEFFSIAKDHNPTPLNIDSVLQRATTHFLVKINQSKPLIVHEIDTKKYGTIWVYLSKENVNEFVKFTRDNANKISNDSLYTPLSNLTKEDMEKCLLRVISNKKVEETPLNVFTHKWLYDNKIISIEPDSVFFISNELSGKDKYDYANLIIFEDGIHIHNA